MKDRLPHYLTVLILIAGVLCQCYLLYNIIIGLAYSLWYWNVAYFLGGGYFIHHAIVYFTQPRDQPKSYRG